MLRDTAILFNVSLSRAPCRAVDEMSQVTKTASKTAGDIIFKMEKLKRVLEDPITYP